MTQSVWKKLEEEINAIFEKEGLKSSVVTPRNHPEFYRSVEKLAEKCGLDFVPSVVVADELSSGTVLTRRIPNAEAWTGSTIVVVNKGMMDITGSHLNRRMTPKLETFMAHEFSHLKDGPSQIKDKLPWMVPLALVLGHVLYGKAKELMPDRNRPDSKEHARQLIAHVETAANQEMKSIDGASAAPASDTWEIDPKWKKRTLEYSKYLLTAAIGTAAGLVAAGRVSVAREFRADEMAVKVTRNPALYKQTLKDIRKVNMRLLKDYIIERKNDPLWTQIKNAYENVIESTMHAHPTDAQRFRHIDQVAESLGIRRR